MRLHAPTQREIAEHLGVSQGLVSRALAGTADRIGASAETVDRILRLAEEWDYRPSAAALALKGASTRTIGVVVKSFEDPYFGQLVGALQGLAREAGHSMLLCGSGPGDVGELRKHRVDGVVLAGSDFAPIGLPDGTPVVQIGTGQSARGASQVCMDEAGGIRELVQHLAELGHGEIAFACSGTRASKRRQAKVRAAAQEIGVRMLPQMELDGNGSTIQLGADVVRNFLTQSHRPTALMACDDLMALSMLLAFQRSGVRVPEDVSLTGIDDIFAAQLSIPPLTTLRQPLETMAECAFQILLGSPARPGQLTQISGELVVRDSTGRISREDAKGRRSYESLVMSGG